MWDLLGNGEVENYLEPFFGSGAVLLGRPFLPTKAAETVNDVDCYVSNFWRATKMDPDSVVEYCNWPVIENDLHARHDWLVNSPQAEDFRDQMRKDPEHYDARVAGWWVWGICQWIGGGWCRDDHSQVEQMPAINKPGGNAIHAKGSSLWEKRPNTHGKGVHVKGQSQGRPDITSAFSRGKAVHSNDRAITEGERREFLLTWFQALRDRLRTVRVCCGDWSRICSSPSTTTRLGVTGVFLDPPYHASTGRDMNLYSSEDGSVSSAVNEWCQDHGDKPKMRIVLCGYEGEHDNLVTDHGWKVEEWKAQGGYGNRGKYSQDKKANSGNENANLERLWISPHCHVQKTLFD